MKIQLWIPNLMGYLSPLSLILIFTGLAIENATAQDTTSITTPTVTNGNNTTTNFLTYTNSSYGIMIQYPSYFIKEDSQNQSSGDIVRFTSRSVICLYVGA
jgi:hypothetical protein